MKNKDLIKILEQNPESECWFYNMGGFCVKLEQRFIRNDGNRTIIQADYDR